MQWCFKDTNRRRINLIVNIEVIVQYVDLNTLVFLCTDIIINCHRRIIYRSYGNGNLCLITVISCICNFICQIIIAKVIFFRSINYCP